MHRSLGQNESVVVFGVEKQSRENHMEDLVGKLLESCHSDVY